MRTLREQISEKCVHYNGLSGPGLNDGPETKSCDAGVKYAMVHDQDRKGFSGYPCFKVGEGVACEKRHFPTDEEVQAEVAEHDRRWEMLKLAFAAVREDGDKKGFGKGHGGQGKVKCPCCADGMLSYSVSGYNGHVHGACSTTGCVRWMQ